MFLFAGLALGHIVQQPVRGQVTIAVRVVTTHRNLAATPKSGRPAYLLKIKELSAGPKAR